jgi:hypothetical protein
VGWQQSTKYNLGSERVIKQSHWGEQEISEIVQPSVTRRALPRSRRKKGRYSSRYFERQVSASLGRTLDNRVRQELESAIKIQVNGMNRGKPQDYSQDTRSLIAKFSSIISRLASPKPGAQSAPIQV